MRTPRWRESAESLGAGGRSQDVTRPLNSVSQVSGPHDGPGLQDVVFNNKCCYVIPPGIVEQIIKPMKPVAKYPREGGLYIADFALTSFARQGQEQ